jgi:uncharacterized membrane protein (DUF373 family)
MRVKMNTKEQLSSDYEAWKLMSFYEKFEQAISLALVFLISVMIVTALYKLAVKVYTTVVVYSVDPTDPSVFQHLFGMIMTLLIAMEFKHSILRVVSRKDSIIQVKTVLLIAILAISRKFIILDTKVITASELAALAFALLALGAVYWLIREQDFQADKKSSC